MRKPAKLKPIKHQTVGWWIKQLQAYDPKKPVILLQGHNDPLFFLSDYDSEDKQFVLIDVGGKNA